MQSDSIVVKRGKARLAVTDRRPEGSAFGTVLALHAGVADRRAYDGVAPIWVEAGWRVVTYDRRGFGETDADVEDHDAVGDLLAVLDDLEIDRAVIVGNSMGGALAVDVALAHPHRVAGLVIVGSTVGGQPWDPERMSQAERDLATAMESAEAAGDVDGVNRLEAHYWLDGPESDEGRVGGDARALFLEMNERALTAGAVGDVSPRPDAWPRLGEITVPTLVVVGLLDEADTVAAGQQLAGEIGRARLVELEGSAHLPMLDDPTRFATVVLEHLRALG